MTEIIEPNPLLVDYIKLSNSLWTSFDNTISEDDEWYYLMSNIEQNILILKRLQEKGLLKEGIINICDVGCGLAAAIFDIYLQSKEFTDRKFNFFGIEKYQKYIDFFNRHLSDFWNGDIEIIKDDVRNQNYSNYDIIYTYSVFRSPRALISFYNQIANDLKPGSIIIENREKGLGFHSVLKEINNLECIQIDDIFVFKKN
jgi:hypothetical protein